MSTKYHLPSAQHRMWLLYCKPTLSWQGFHGDVLLHHGLCSNFRISNFNRLILQALQTIALFGLKLNRFPAALGALTFFLLYDRHFPMGLALYSTV